jgi:hypothetical protein
MGQTFLDASFAIALSSREDLHHFRAKRLADDVRKRSTRLVTTQAVLLEIGNGLAKLKYRRAAVKLLRAIEEDPRIELIPLTDELLGRSLDLFEQRPDKEWGLTDCISFLVMSDRGIQFALTTDEHFEQAGFVALLRGEK